MEEKYVVFRADEFWDWFANGDPDKPPAMSTTKLIDDAVVIRMQDTFAPSALYTYASSIQTALELISDIAAPSRVEHLANLRDYFFSKAEQSKNMTKKVPD